MTKKLNIKFDSIEINEMLALEEFAIETLEKFAKHFCKNDFLSKEDFFIIQQKILKTKAKKYKINLKSLSGGAE